MHYFFSNLIPVVARRSHTQMGFVRERDGWKKKNVIGQKRRKNNGNAEMKEGQALGMLLAQLRQTENEKDEAEVLYSGGGGSTTW